VQKEELHIFYSPNMYQDDEIKEEEIERVCDMDGREI